MDNSAFLALVGAFQSLETRPYQLSIAAGVLPEDRLYELWKHHQTFDAGVHAIEWFSDGLAGIELRPCDPADCAIFTAGAYHRYAVAVAMDPASPVISLFVHAFCELGKKHIDSSQ